MSYRIELTKKSGENAGNVAFVKYKGGILRFYRYPQKATEYTNKKVATKEARELAKRHDAEWRVVTCG